MIPDLSGLTIDNNKRTIALSTSRLLSRQMPICAPKRPRTPTESSDFPEDTRIQTFIQTIPLYQYEDTPFDLSDIRGLAIVLRQTADTDCFVFSTCTDNDSTIRAYHGGDPLAIMSSSIYNDLILEDSSTCGSYNCFVDDIRLDDTTTKISLEYKLLNVVTQLGCKAPVNNTVALRFPKLSKTYVNPYLAETKSMDNDDELALTLFMATKSMTPPVYAAFPIYRYNTRFWVYVVENGWVQFTTFMLDLQNNGPWAGKDATSISTTLVTLMDRVASFHILLMDVKTLNMVARWNDNNKCEIKMIDFGPDFTTILGIDQNAASTQQCVYVINGLLLLNFVYATGYKRITRRRYFGDLALRVWSAWQCTRHVFCASLELDNQRKTRVETKAWKRENLLRTDEDVLKALSMTFYKMLNQYGDPGVLYAADIADGSDSYIDRFVTEIVANFTDVQVVSSCIPLMESSSSL